MRTRGRHSFIAVIVGLVMAVVATVAPSGARAEVDFPRRSYPLTQGYEEVQNGRLEGVQGQEEPGDAFGRAVTFGDFDGDGFDDLVIGSPGEDFGTEFDDSGAVNVIYGGPDGPRLDNDRFIDQSDFVGVGPEDGDWFGHAVAAGDFDGDGFDDLAVSAPGESLGGVSDAGNISILYGSVDGIDTNRSQNFNQGGSTFPGGNEPGDYLGWALAAGDFDGDGRDDLAIGTPYESINYGGTIGDLDLAGSVVILFGTPSGLNTAGSQVFTQQQFGTVGFPGQFGFSLAVADIDGDGIDDLAVGVPTARVGGAQTGAVFFYYGAETGLRFTGDGVSELTLWSDPADRVMRGGDRFGHSIALAEVPGGVLFVGGAPNTNVSNTSFAGAAYSAFLPHEDVFDARNVTAHYAGETGQNQRSGAGFGWSVAFGDVHGDRDPDLVVGALRLNQANLWPGGGSLNYRGARAQVLIPASVVALGDVDGDGADDLALGRGWDDESSQTGFDPFFTVSGRVDLRLAVYDGPRVFRPERFLDTRPGEATIDAESAGEGIVAGGTFAKVRVAGRGSVPPDTRTVIVNVTAVRPAGKGYLTLFACDTGAVPTASNLNYDAGENRANTTMVSLDQNGDLCVFTFADAHLLLDVLGVAGRTRHFTALGPVRLLDTREGEETFDAEFAGIGRVEAEATTRFSVFPRFGNRDDIVAVMLNVTAVNPDARGFLTVWDCSGDPPTASALNFEAGQNVANGVFVEPRSDGDVCVYSSVATDLVVDFNGFSALVSGVEPTTPSRLLDTRPGEAVGGVAGGEGRVAVESVTRVQVAGSRGLPDDISFATVNLTVVSALEAGFATLFPCEGEVPNASSINFPAGSVTANNAMVALDDDGGLCIFSKTSAHLILDVGSTR